MRRATLALAVMLACCRCAIAAQAAADSSENALAGESLRHSAMMLINASAEAPARAARLLTVAQFAQRLDGDHPRTEWLLASIYEIQGRTAAASDAMAAMLAHRGDDYATAVRWLTTKLATFDTADRRIAFLQSLMEGEQLPEATPALRAEAAVHLARIFQRQGRGDRQRQALRRALRWAEDHPEALRALLVTEDSPTPARRVETLLGILRGNPLAVGVAWELAGLLNSLGLHREAVEIFEYAWTVYRRRNEMKSASPAFVTQYFNAMLDAGMGAQAAEKFSPMLEIFGDHMDLKALMVEALRELGRDDEARELVKTMLAVYTADKAAVLISQTAARELAWFYLVIDRRPSLALAAARNISPVTEDPVSLRILAAVELANDQADRAVARLETLVHQDTYAAALLAEHFFAQGDDASARQAIAAAAKLNRGGPAFRKLLAVGAAHDVEIPPAEGSDLAGEAMGVFDRSCLEPGRSPEKFLDVTLRAVSPRVEAAQAIFVEVTLTNRGGVAVSMGQWGLVTPSLSLSIQAAVAKGPRFTDIPLAVLPARRWLAPQQSVSTTVRVDVGQLSHLLASRPLEEVRLDVSAMIDPVRKGSEFQSALPSIQIEPIRIVRLSLIRPASPGAKPTPEAYQQTLRRIVGDFRRGDPPIRMRAARQVASLLLTVAEVDAGRVQLAPSLRQAVTRPLLLSMTQALLGDRSAVVRAEMLTALQQAPIDRSLLMLLGNAVSDPSPLVRMRVAELLGASNTKTNQAVLRHLSRDADPLVRQMAEAFVTNEASDATGTSR